MVAARRPTERGFTVLEISIGLAVIGILLTAALGGIRAHQVAAVRSMRTLEASRAASSRLESLRTDHAALPEGERSFEPLMKGARGVQRVQRLEDGLYAVQVRVVHDGAGVAATLHTLVAREHQP